MSIDVRNKGDLVRITATFTDVDGALVDPGTITLKVMDPSGNVDTYTYSADVTKSSVGVYYKDLNVDEEGDWHCWWLSTGSGQGAEPTQFVCAPTPF